MGVSGSLGGDTEDACGNGERAYIEVSSGGRAISLSRNCVATTDPAGRLALRLSEIAGSRTEEELARAAQTGRVSARGDMGWTWGTSTYTAPDGTRTPGRYVSIWTRDAEGNWRYSFDAPIR